VTDRKIARKFFYRRMVYHHCSYPTLHLF